MVRFRGDRGQAVPLVAMMWLVLSVSLLVVATAGRAVGDRARAHSAADAAALAGVRDGRTAADEIARANGGRLVSFVAVDGEVEVTVEVDRARATARARLEPVR
jgi:hypothetical protein